jgi:hypothetical protein
LIVVHVCVPLVCGSALTASYRLPVDRQCH